MNTCLKFKQNIYLFLQCMRSKLSGTFHQNSCPSALLSRLGIIRKSREKCGWRIKQEKWSLTTAQTSAWWRDGKEGKWKGSRRLRAVWFVLESLAFFPSHLRRAHALMPLWAQRQTSQILVMANFHNYETHERGTRVKHWIIWSVCLKCFQTAWQGQINKFKDLLSEHRGFSKRL